MRKTEGLQRGATITLRPEQKKMKVRAGQTIASALSGKVWIDLPCGGMGKCGRCMVMACGGLTPPDDAEARILGEDALAAGFRLACRAVVVGDATITLPRGRPAAVAGEGPGETGAQAAGPLSLIAGVPGSTIRHGRPAKPYRREPFAGTIRVKVDGPSIESQEDDLARLRDSLRASNGRQYEFTVEAIRGIPRAIRECEGNVSVVYSGDRIISAMGAPAETGGAFGVAMDAGTTTLAAYLLDLGNGRPPRVVGALSATNPQVSHGADVISRITYAASSDGGVGELTGLLLEGLNRLVTGLCGAAGIAPSDIWCGAAVGNTCMTSLLVGADPQFLGRAPYVPPFKQAFSVTAREIGLKIHPRSSVWIAPGIAGYVGGDTVAVATVIAALNPQGTWLAVDIGTNGEILLNAGGRLLACSAAAGPAFEGREITCGMRAGPGAISDVRIRMGPGGPGVDATVIGGGEPSGLCGSGLIRTIVEMLSSGILEPDGRFNKDAAPSRELVLGLGPGGIPVRLTQKDVRALQFAKAALRTGINTLLEEAGVEPDAIDDIYLAGAFGNHIEPADAVSLGLLPPVELSRVRPVGNAAGLGAQLFLLSREARGMACSIARRAEHVELSANKSFQGRFLSSFEFPCAKGSGVRGERSG